MMLGERWGVGGADPLVRGRRPRRPAHTWQGADIVAPAAGRGRLARTRGSAPPLPPDLQLRQKVCVQALIADQNVVAAFDHVSGTAAVLVPIAQAVRFQVVD